MQNKFIDLIRSTVELHQRFNTAQSIDVALTMVDEEYQEVILAIENNDIGNLHEEIVDVFVTLIGLYLAFTKSTDGSKVFKNVWSIARVLRGLHAPITRNNITYESLVPYMDIVIKKNDSKTLETHHINAQGKIARKTVE